jgi:hypothetical protein
MNKSKHSEASGPEDIFGPVIYVYTRAQAIEDGVLVDVSKPAREAGIRLPTALTAAVHARYVTVPDELIGEQDDAGRLWDLLWMFAHAVGSGKLAGAEGTYEVLVALPANASWEAGEKPTGDGLRVRLVTLKAVCGPADDGSPCITIMKPDED